LKSSREPKKEQADNPVVFMIKCIKCKSEFDQGKSNHRKCANCQSKKVVKIEKRDPVKKNMDVEKQIKLENKFDENNMHYITKTKFDKKLFNKYGINRITSTKFDKHGYDKFGHNKNGYDKNGYDKFGDNVNGNSNKPKKKNFSNFYN